MKKNILLASLCTILSFSSCDNYLDIVPKGESVMNTTEDYLGLLEPLKAHYPIDEFGYTTDEWTWNDRWILENYSFRLRSACFFWNENYDRANNTVSDTGGNELYNICYERISRYNILIKNIDKADGPESDKLLGTAQAKLMRAYNYFFLINTFAKPYRAETAATDKGIILRKVFVLEEKGVQSSIADAYAFILQDINEAINELPKKAVSVFRPDKAFGYAFRSKVHLYMGNIDEALNDALEVLKFDNHRLFDYNTMVTNYFAANTPPPSAAMESMFWQAIANTEFINIPREDPENLFYGYNSMGGSATCIRKPIMDLYVKDFTSMLGQAMTSDLRPNLLYNVPNGGGNLKGEPESTRFLRTLVFPNECGMRLAEVYLIIAECYARKGNVELTIKYLNDLRKKRLSTQYSRDLDPTKFNKDQAFQEVRDERRRELVISCNGFFDMRRFITEFNETWTKTYINSQGATITLKLKPGSHLLTFPFPVAAMQTSDLTQNSH